MSEDDKALVDVKPLFSCSEEGCREEVSYYADMLAELDGKLICENCYDEWPFSVKPRNPDDPEEWLSWNELPQFKPPWEKRIEQLTAEVKRLRGANQAAAGCVAAMMEECARYRNEIRAALAGDSHD